MDYPKNRGCSCGVSKKYTLRSKEHLFFFTRNFLKPQVASPRRLPATFWPEESAAADARGAGVCQDCLAGR
jgi:hypothetical protein